MIYRNWANILVKHEYFGGRCNHFHFLPDSASKEIMKREGFLTKETSEGFYLIAPESVFKKEIKLVFWASPTRQEIWSATLFRGVPKESIPFVRAKGNSLLWKSIDKSTIPETKLFPTPMFGIEISHPNDVSTSKTTLYLQAKKMKWRYNISGLSEFREPEVIGIKKNGDNALFNISTDASGNTIFTSTQDIPLNLCAAPRFQLREKNSAKAIIKSLPNMDARSIATAILDNGNKETIAEAFINI